jgi:hypothetical protein
LPGFAVSSTGLSHCAVYPATPYNALVPAIVGLLTEKFTVWSVLYQALTPGPVKSTLGGTPFAIPSARA